VSALIGLVTALQARPAPVAAAATHAAVEPASGLVADRAATVLQFETYTDEATLLANVMASDPVRQIIARDMHLDPQVMTSRARITGSYPVQFTDTVSETRANQIAVTNRPYKLEVQADPNLPMIAIYGQGPTPAAAAAIANLAVPALDQYLAGHPELTGLGRLQTPLVQQLGVARGAVVNGQSRLEGTMLAFLVAFGLAAGGAFGLMRVRRGFVGGGQAARKRAAATLPPAPHSGPALRRLPGPGGDWPRTTRVMPWLVALFLVIIWLVPFNDIQLPVNLPFDLKLDRIVLPVVALVWILSLAAGGPGAPRPRVTRIHIGFLVFLGVVGLGIVADSSSLTQMLEFNLATKKLSLLISYGVLLAIVASSVRRNELPAFFRFSLILSVLCAIGAIYEYRYHYNVFYDLSSKLLGKVFQVGAYNPNELDELGRRMVRGPSDHPLELTGMLVMMFPVAFVGILSSDRRRDRLLYGLAACLLIAACVSTDRKTSLLAPLAVVLTVGYHYRGKLLRLAPLTLILVLAIHILSPGALGTVVNQLNPSNLGVSTVSDRAAAYDAVRPDLWSHLILGRGYGTYDHLNYRTLDSDMLNRLIDVGIGGIAAMLVMLGSIMTVARRMMRAREPDGAPLALAVAAATVSYIVLLFLFDVSSFPHVPYIMFSLAGLLAAGEQPTGVSAEMEPAGPAPDRRPPAASTPVWRLPAWNPRRASGPERALV
jgi:hypothetical protein